MYKHYSQISFRAICGSDVPNQSTTKILENTDCPYCLNKIYDLQKRGIFYPAEINPQHKSDACYFERE